MTSQHDKAKRWRPRFSVRTLVIVVTLVCAYLASWEATKREGITDVTRVRTLISDYQVSNEDGVTVVVTGYVYDHPSSPLPFLVSVRRYMDAALDTNSQVLQPQESRGRIYYFWFFGYVAKLPFERVLPIDNPSPVDDFISKVRREVGGGGWTGKDKAGTNMESAEIKTAHC